MATDMRALPAYFNTDADFRTWGTGIAAQLTACGLTQTSNTGQINWTTVTKPSANGTLQGYEIWRFADTLQSTAPFFIRLDYGSGSFADTPSLFVQVGTGTNGAGTLTGVTSQPSLIYSSHSKSAGVTLNSYCCGSTATGRIMLMNNVDPADWWCWQGFCIERARDGSGVTSGDGVGVQSFSKAGSFTNSYQLLPSVVGSAPAILYNGRFPICISPQAITSAQLTYGSNVALFPVPYFIGKVYWSMNLGYLDPTFTAFSPFTATHLGATHTFLPLGTLLPYGPWAYGGDFTCQLAMLWE
jgi:hypothetical protein